jgi:hypothetical protein
MLQVYHVDNVPVLSLNYGEQFVTLRYEGTGDAKILFVRLSVFLILRDFHFVHQVVVLRNVLLDVLLIGVKYPKVLALAFLKLDALKCDVGPSYAVSVVIF